MRESRIPMRRDRPMGAGCQGEQVSLRLLLTALQHGMGDRRNVAVKDLDIYDSCHGIRAFARLT